MSKRAHNFTDISGQQFGHITVIRYIGHKRGGSQYLCRCDCGIEKEINGATLKDGRVTSCGCRMAKSGQDNGNFKYGVKNFPEYSIWRGMLQRCYDQNCNIYPYYGGRGITVCNEWRESFLNFYHDMCPRPSSKHSIDRVDNNGPYSKDNCRWATRKQQAQNRRNTLWITYNGKTQSIATWAKELQIGYSTLHCRLQILDWPVEKALTTPSRQQKR